MRTILVVDDNKKIVDVLSEYLRAEGFATLAATDGDAGLSLAIEHHPDLALVDVMLPGTDGIEITRRLLPMGIPVILVTARSDEIDRLIGLEVGADDYVTKPFSPREVVARVKAVLRRVDRSLDIEADAPIHVGDLVIDPRRRLVRVGERTVELTRSEFDLLTAMAAHPGRVYTRGQLLEIVSGEAFEGYERTIDAHIKNVRKKLGEDPRASRYIHTVIGVGYKVGG
ncbi:MAG: response regulator transcription factor [Coriobacteriia bacterium]|nr:response regulator transcription factor [Coriobacteriia bacterium]